MPPPPPRRTGRFPLVLRAWLKYNAPRQHSLLSASPLGGEFADCADMLPEVVNLRLWRGYVDDLWEAALYR